MNNCSPWIHEIYQGIFEICTDLGILVVNAKYAQKYTLAYTRFFAQCISILSSFDAIIPLDSKKQNGMDVSHIALVMWTTN